MSLKKDSIKFYICPACRSELTLRQEFLICASPMCRRRFDIIRLIPCLTVDDSTVLDPSDHEAMIKD